MLDLGTSFVASVERDPEGLAIVDGAVRLTGPHRDPASEKTSDSSGAPCGASACPTGL